MSTPKDVLDIIQSYLVRQQASLVSYSQLLNHVDRYLLENPDGGADLEDLRRAAHKTLSTHLDTLEKEGDIRIVRKETAIQSIVYPGYFMERIRQIYARSEEKPELPYPNLDSIRLDIPGEDICSIDIKSDFVLWLDRDPEPVRIVKINFPDGILSLVATSDLLRTKVLTNAVHRIRHYLRDSKNMAYTKQKLVPLLKSRELAVKDLLHSIVATPDAAAATIAEPTDFTFHLWTQLSTNVIKDMAQKPDKLAEEHGVCQAAYLIGYYNVFFRGQIQKRKDEDSALNALLSAMRRPPFSFRITEIYEIKDDKGILITKRLDKERINDYVKERLVPAQNRETPDFLRVTTSRGEEYYLMYAVAPVLILDSVLRVQKEMREFYSRSWPLALRQDIAFTTMYGDDQFRDHVALRLHNHYPLLEALLSYPIVYFASRQDGLTETQRNDLMELINPATQKLKPVDQIFRLNRKRMFDDAKMLLPAWMVIPVLKTLILLGRKLFLGRQMASAGINSVFDHEGQEHMVFTKKKAVSSTGEGDEAATGSGAGSSKAATAKQQAQRLRAAAKELESEFLPRGAQIAPTLDSLEARWNNQIDPVAKKNLTEDLNSLVRDYLRKSRITSKSKMPTADDIRIHAQKVWESDSLLQIRNRKDLLRYIELYIILVLENAK